MHKKILGFVGGLGIPVVSTVASLGREILPGNGGAPAAPAPRPTTQAQIDAMIMANVQTQSWGWIAEMAGQTIGQVQGRYYNVLRSGAPPPAPAPLPASAPRRDFETIATANGLAITDNGGVTGTCRPGSARDPSRGEGCFPIAGQPAGLGEATMGRFGAGLQPGARNITTRFCPRGAVLGLDGLCYNRKDITNKERWWPRGRRPLLTGGEMRAIAIASAAAKKLQRKQKQLRELGLLKAPPARRPKQKQLAAGHHAHVAHD